MTLFFGQLFVTVVNNGNRISILGLTRGYDLTGGPNGIADIDPFHFFGLRRSTVGHAATSTSRSASSCVVLVGALPRSNESRTGRAWRSLREDPLAAELMGMPVNRLKLIAFAFGAGDRRAHRHASSPSLQHGRLRRRLRRAAPDHGLRDA